VPGHPIESRGDGIDELNHALKESGLSYDQEHQAIAAIFDWVWSVASRYCGVKIRAKTMASAGAQRGHFGGDPLVRPSQKCVTKTCRIIESLSMASWDL